MAFMNYSGSLRYDMQGRKRKAYKKNNPTKKKQASARSSSQVRTTDCLSANTGSNPVRAAKSHIPSMKPSINSGGHGTGVDSDWQAEKLRISQGYTIAPAYNKGAYQVIGKNNIKDIGK